MRQVTDLRPWFTENLNMNNLVTGAWIFTDGEKKQLVIKFNGTMSKMERAVYLRLIAKALMNTAADEDEKAGGKSSFGDLMDGMQLREWHKEDNETIKGGITHDIAEQEEKTNE